MAKGGHLAADERGFHASKTAQTSGDVESENLQRWMDVTLSN
jgi:hypothetical protein